MTKINDRKINRAYEEPKVNFLPSPFLKMIFKSLKLICAIGSGFDQHNQSGRFFEPITLHSFTLQINLHVQVFCFTMDLYDTFTLSQTTANYAWRSEKYCGIYQDILMLWLTEAARVYDCC